MEIQNEGYFYTQYVDMKRSFKSSFIQICHQQNKALEAMEYGLLGSEPRYDFPN